MQKPQAKALRIMLGRGQACVLCRTRKVKCNGDRPCCSQCTKSAKLSKDDPISLCVYEDAQKAKKPPRSSTTLVPASSSTALPTLPTPPALFERISPDPANSNVLNKREREVVDEAEEESFERVERYSEGSDAPKKKSARRVEALVDRITELERKLEQASTPSHLHTHLRTVVGTPPFHQSFLGLYHESSSVPMDASRDSHSRRSMSYNESDIRAEYLFPQESSLRSTDEREARGSGSDRGSGSVATYASFMPPLPPLDGFDDEKGQQDLLPTQRKGFTGYSNQVYPPLNYSPGLGLHSGLPLPTTNGRNGSFSHSGYQLPPDSHGPPGSTSTTHSSLAGSPEDLPLDPTFLQMMLPSWPRSLPSPKIVVHLINVFFNRAIVPSSMLNKARLLSSLRLDPTHPSFPHTSLLHAICAFAAVFCSSETLGLDGDRLKYWETEKTPRDYHYACAREEIDLSIVTMSKGLFQVLQACVICCYICYAQAEFEALWLLSGTATRLVTPLGLNHLAPYVGEPSFPGDWRASSVEARGRKMNTTLLAPPKDREEHYERCATFWAVFSIDRHASSSTGWSTSIDELDISTQLPCYGEASRASVTISHPQFVDSFAAPVGSLGIYVKAVVLLGRVINYTQRESYEMSGKTPAEVKRAVKASPAFRELDFALSKFRTATSANVFEGDSIDGHLASAYVIPHAASILLHEGFCDVNDRSPTSSIARSLVSAKCVVNSTYLLYESSSDLSGCDPFLPFCWGVVGRALVRDYAVKSLWGEEESAISSRTLAEHCLSFTARCAKIRGTNIAKVMTANMRELLANPEVTLPVN